ncbi:MAG: hypothetical protein AB7H71_08995 [Alphaproteobacteria bacterium]
MSENVVYLHRQPEPVAHYLRLGTFHRQVEKRLAAGRLPVERVVVEASAFTHQKDPKRHYMHQRAKPLERLSRVSEARRVDDFLKHDLDPAARTAETAAKLAVGDVGMTEMLQRTNERLARLGQVLRDLHATVGDCPHFRAPARRGNGSAGARAARR